MPAAYEERILYHTACRISYRVSDISLLNELKRNRSISDIFDCCTTFAYGYLDSAIFGYPLAEKKQPLSTGQRLFLLGEINPLRDL